MNWQTESEDGDLVEAGASLFWELLLLAVTTVACWCLATWSLL